MRCQAFRASIHDLLDGELPLAETVALTAHLESCPACAGLHNELSAIIRELRGREELPQHVAEQLWSRIRTEIRWSLWTSLKEAWGNFRSFCRDFDKAILWSRVSAAPITLTFFIVILSQFSRFELYQLTYPAFGLTQSVITSDPNHMVGAVHVRQQGSVIAGLTDTVWRIPYEDSLSLVAEITPEGRARIEDVLEYPRSADLLQAVDLTLQESRFQTASSQNRTFVLFSLQKIDVYEW